MKRAAELAIGIFLFILGGMAYVFSIGFSFLYHSLLPFILGFSVGASLITLSLIKFLYKDEIGMKHESQANNN